MNAIRSALPAWARPKVERFQTDRSSPIEGGRPSSVSATEGKAHRAVIERTAAELIAADNNESDQDPRPGFVSTDLMGTGMPIEYRFEQEGDSLELAYSFAEGHLALYMKTDPNSSLMVDLTHNGGEHDLAVFVDHRDPSNSISYML